MRLRALVTVAVFHLAALASIFAASPLPRSVPEKEGVSSSAIQRLVEELSHRDLGLHSIMIVRHGQVIAEGWWAPYRAEAPHTLYSLSKSFTSTAVGIAQAEGKLSINDPVLKYFPDEAPANPSANLKAMRIRDLLMMSTGQHGEDIDKVRYFGGDSIAKQFLAIPVVHKPGTLFYYNTPATYMLSAIVQKATGQTTLDYLKPRLFEPLGIENPVWERDEQGVTLGGFGLHLDTESIAKFGQLYLQRGEWKGKRLVPGEWVEAATARQASNGSNPDSDWDQGYGYQFWRCKPGFYRADGAFGQFCIVMPQFDTVVAINSGSRDMGAIMQLIWDRLLPELRPGALPENPEAHTRMKATLLGLKLPVPATLNGAPNTTVLGKKYILGPNPMNDRSLVLTVEGDTHVVALEGEKSTVKVRFRPGDWLEVGTVPKQWINLSPDLPDPTISTSGTWTAPDVFTGKIAFNQGPNVATLTLKFSGNELTGEWKMNVGFGANEPIIIHGKAE